MKPVSALNLTVSTETGATGPAVGRLILYPRGLRVLVALIWLLIGFGGAAALIVVPVVHLFSTWALPLAGILGAINTVKTAQRVSHVTGNCPACQGKLLLAGGRAKFPMRESCEHCSRPLILNLAGG
jgi:uncharacterized membrane protein